MLVRSLHYDMKGMTPKPEYMVKLCRNIASFGFNYLLVEFEDRFPYRGQEFPVHPDAYTGEQLKALDTPELKVIPLLQSAGHLDYVLKHRQMKRYRKNNSVYRWDMAKPETFELWRSMADEILGVFPDCEYFHIGADEVDMFEEGDFETYVHHIEKCADYLIAKGKQVIIWDDVFRKHPVTDLTRSLFRKVIVQVWQYGTVDEKPVADMVGAGARVWGASRVQFHGNFDGFGPQEVIKSNLDQWTVLNKKYDLEGHTGTLWGRYQGTTPLCSSIPAGMAMIAYLGKSLTANGIPDYDKFCGEFAGFFGDTTLEMKTILSSLNHSPYEAEIRLHPVPQNNDLMEIWQVLNSIDHFYAWRDLYFHNNWARLKLYRTGELAPKSAEVALKNVQFIRERIAALTEDIDEVLGKYYTKTILEEYKSERFDYVTELNDQQEKDILLDLKLFGEKH